MASISEDEVKHVADLAKLDFDKDELGKFTAQFDNIIDMFKQLQEVDTKGVEPMTSATDRVNVMRDDKAVRQTDQDREALLKNAPDTGNGLIKVPAIIDESEDADK